MAFEMHDEWSAFKVRVETEHAKVVQKRKEEEKKKEEEEAARKEAEERERIRRLTEKEREEEVERRKERARRKQRRSAILENEVNRPGTTSEEDKRWWKETFEDEMEKAIERARCADYEDKVKERAKSLPADSNAKGEELVNLALYPPFFELLGVVEDGCNAAIGFFEQPGFASLPAGATEHTFSYRTPTLLPGGECVVFVRTQPARARAAAERGGGPLAAICWSVTFPERFDVAIKNRLKEKNYVALAIRSQQTLRIALNAMWQGMSPEEKTAAQSWTASRYDSEVKSTPAAPHRASNP